MFAKKCATFKCSTAHLEASASSLYPAVPLCPQVASLFFFYPDGRLLLRFAQTLASDLAAGKRSLGSLSLSLSPLHPRCIVTALPTWVAGANVRAGVPSPAHTIHGAAVVKGASSYHIWRRGVALLCRPHCSHTVIAVINWAAVPLRYPPAARLSHTHTHSQDQASSADLVSSPPTERRLTRKNTHIFFLSVATV